MTVGVPLIAFAPWHGQGRSISAVATMVCEDVAGFDLRHFERASQGLLAQWLHDDA